MRELSGRCAVVTGAAGLIGRALALCLAEAGMDVVVADIRGDAATGVAEEVGQLGVRGLAVETDVAEPGSVEALAERAYGEFGAVHLLCNNAGVNVMRPLPELTYDDWRRVLSVNLEGVVNGLVAFLPRLIRQGGWRHIVNTASMSGVGLGRLRPNHAPYVASKFAVVGLTETLAPALEPYGIGVSVLCPGLVSSDPDAPFRSPAAEWYRGSVLAPTVVAQEVLRGVREGRLHIFTHLAGLAEVEERHAALREGFERVPERG